MPGTPHSFVPPDGKFVLTASDDGTARLWDAIDGTPRSKPMQHQERVNSAVFSPDGKTLAAGYVDGTLGLWDVGTGAARHMVESGGHRIHSVAWNSTGDLLVTAGPAGRG